MHPELQMQHTVAIGLAAQNCQFDSPCDDLAQCSFPAKPNSELVHLNSPLQVIYGTTQKDVWIQDPSTTQLASNFTSLYNKIKPKKILLTLTVKKIQIALEIQKDVDSSTS